MRYFRSARWLLLAFLVSLIPATSHAGVFISVGFAPPPLVVYEQPPCPEAGWMWQPGYWAYGDDGYYWVPGTWVPAPYEGALWTPGYWGFGGGMYVWHPGYWGPHVGYYGGVNYGFGYMGIGFVGGEWRGREFAYNRAVVNVNTAVIRNVYVDRTIVERNTIVNERHVAYEGGPGGIRHDPTPQERMAEHEHHMAATSYQVQHRDAAMQNRNAYFNNNHGHPTMAAAQRPMTAPGHPANMGRQQQQMQQRNTQEQQRQQQMQQRNMQEQQRQQQMQQRNMQEQQRQQQMQQRNMQEQQRQQQMQQRNTQEQQRQQQMQQRQAQQRQQQERQQQRPQERPQQRPQEQPHNDSHERH